MKYVDKNGKTIKAGMALEHNNGDREMVYSAIDGDLGLNANGELIASFHEVTIELCSLDELDLNEWKVVE